MYACLRAEGNWAILAECARYFSPRWEETSANAVVVDMRGSHLLFGSPQEIAAAMTTVLGFQSMSPLPAIQILRPLRHMAFAALALFRPVKREPSSLHHSEHALAADRRAIQNVDGVIQVRAKKIRPLSIASIATASHDLH
jgi:hypothetical protein